jgi:uncharacterized protein YprB with RNaseH-like and TPR domain
VARAGEIVAFDVETTGLSPHRGHRVIETGAVREAEGYSYGQTCIAFQPRPDGVEKGMALWVR